MPPRDFLSAIGRALNTRRSGEADIWTNYQVVQPLDPRGLTMVKSECNDQPIVVGNVSGLTFAPGASVMIGTNTNRPGKAIIAGAPPGRMGASRVPQDFASRTYGAAPPVASTCPAAITGKSYLGIWYDAGIGVLHAWRYLDGAFQEAIGTIDISADDWTFPLSNFQRVNTETETVICLARRDGGDHILTLDFAAETYADLDCDSDHVGGPIWTGGSDVYFSVSWTDVDGKHLTLHKVALGASGLVDLVATQQGTELLDPDFFIMIPDAMLLWSAGPKFQIPCFWFESGTEIVIPYWSGGAWSLGAGRATIAGPEDTGTVGNGYASAAGGYSVRVSYTPGTNSNVGVMPTGPGTPEVAMLPADWNISDISEISLSPNGAQAAMFPVAVEGEPATSDQLLRLPIQATPIASGCPLNLITVEEGPEGIPIFMLCRD